MIIYLLPFIAASIGWFTNYIAIKMLFHPREPVDLGFYVLQGIFPKRQREIAKRLGTVVAEELISSDEIKDRILNTDNINTINNIIESKIDLFLENKFPEKFPLMSMFVSSHKKYEVKDQLLKQVEIFTPEILDDYLGNLDEVLQIDKMVEEQVNLMSSDKLETLLLSIIEKEFRFIEYIGALIGFLIGLAQVALISFA